MRIINNPDAIKKTAMTSELNRLAIALIGYLFITSMISLVMIFITGADINGIVYLISSIIGLVFICLLYRGDFHFEDITEDTREIPPKVLINTFVVVLGTQPVFQLIGQGITALFRKFDYEFTYSAFGSDAKGSFFILFNLVIVGPIVEEIIFRGLLLRGLAAYGRNFAIVTTSVLFGLYHAELVSNIYAFTVGVILAYITLRYSIKWAVIIHCSNNMVMIIIDYLNIPYQLNYGILGIFFLWGIIILILKRKKISKYFHKGKSKKNAYKYTFTNMYVLAYIVLTIVLTVISIDLTSVYK